MIITNKYPNLWLPDSPRTSPVKWWLQQQGTFQFVLLGKYQNLHNSLLNICQSILLCFFFLKHDCYLGMTCSVCPTYLQHFPMLGTSCSFIEAVTCMSNFMRSTLNSSTTHRKMKCSKLNFVDLLSKQNEHHNLDAELVVENIPPQGKWVVLDGSCTVALPQDFHVEWSVGWRMTTWSAVWSLILFWFVCHSAENKKLTDSLTVG